MKKNYFFKLCLVQILLVLTMYASAQIQYSLQEGFENGIPAEWIQEHVSGDVAWIVERGGINPNGAAEGNARVALRNTTTQTQGFVTRLVSPVMNLKDVYQPILIFSHAQEHNLGDVDELKVYYRTSSTGTWILLVEYTDRIRNWQQDTILLVGVNETYQVAFEGTDKYGNGIVLDNIGVRPLPVCTKPEVTVVTDPTSTSFNLNWMASFDTQQCAVKVSLTPLDDPESATDLVLDTIVNTFSCPVMDLEMNTMYYCYIKGFCFGEESDWSDAYSYRTMSILNVPHTENFNKNQNTGFVDRLSGWTWKGQVSAVPFINTQTILNNRVYYSNNGSTCVVFANNNSVESAIPAGEYSYLATPEIQIDDLSKIQVSFWGTAYKFAGDSYESGIIVGVMTDPEDFSTFVSIDNIYIKKDKFFEEFTVPLSSYSGTGKYIAFVSNFDKPNLFYMDDLVIEPINDCPKIMGLNVSQITDESAMISCNKYHAEIWNLIITNELFDDPQIIEQDKVVFNKEGITDSYFLATGLPDGQGLYAYAQADCGNSKGAIANPVAFRTPCKLNSLPVSYSFEEEEGWLYTKDVYNSNWNATSMIPPCIIPGAGETMYPPTIDKQFGYGRTGTYYLDLRAPNNNEGSYGYVAFPRIDAVRDVQISCWIRLYGSSESYKGTSKLEIGVMDNPYDISTFVPVDTFYATGLSNEDYMKCNVIFRNYNYNSEGKYIAFRQGTVEKNDVSFPRTIIDDVVIEEAPPCTLPNKLEVSEFDGTAKFSWISNNTQNYRILVDEVDMSDLLEDPSYQPMYDKTVESNTATFEGLKAVSTYYYTIQSVCDQDKSPWEEVMSFKTGCAVKNPLPYTEDFEGYDGGSSIKEIPGCWTTNFSIYGTLYGTYYYPYISTSNPFDGTKSLYLTGSKSSPTTNDYVILPEMEAPINELQISFMLRKSSNHSYVQVGVISNITDTTTFEPLVTIQGTDETNNKYEEVIVSFANYTGSGKNIMIRTPYVSGSNWNNIDAVIVDYIPDCPKPQKLKVGEITNTSAELSWVKGGDETEWNLMILKNEGANPENATPEDIVFSGRINRNPYIATSSVNGLQPNTDYYYYLQSVCGAQTSEWTKNIVSFRTLCGAQSIEQMITETFEDGETQFECWTTGTKVGSTLAPYIFSHLGTKGLRFFHSTSSNGAYGIMPQLDVDSIKRVEISFSASSNSNSATAQHYIIVGVITDINDLASFIAIDTIRTVYQQFNDYVVRFDNYGGDYMNRHGKYIMFLSETESGKSNEVILDNVSVDHISDCRGPISAVAETIETYGAHITWEDTGAANYRLKLASRPLTKIELNDENLVAVVRDTIVDEPKIFIDGLDPITIYYMYVQAICDNETASNWSVTRSFKTACIDKYDLPYIDNFDTYGTGTSVRPDCWSYYYGNGTNIAASYPNVSGSFDNSLDGNASFYLYTANTVNYYCMAVTPKLNVENISTSKISFDLLQATDITQLPRLIVGLTDDPTKLIMDGFFPIDTICLAIDQVDAKSHTWYNYSYDLSEYASHWAIENYKHVVLVVNAGLNRQSATSTVRYSGGYYVDNFRVEMISDCQQPENIIIESRTSNSVQLKWTDELSSNWNIEHGPAGFQRGTGTIVSSTVNTINVTNLSSGTDYDFYIKSNCSSDGESPWVGPIRSTTLCIAPENVYYGFEEEEGYYFNVSSSYKIADCWITNAVSSNPTYIPYNIPNSTSNYACTGKYALRFSVVEANPYAYAVMPEIQGGLDNKQLRFNARALYTYAAQDIASNYTDDEYPHIIIGSFSDPFDFSTFKEITTVELSRWVKTDTAKVENNFLWDDIVVPLHTAEGKYVTFMVSYEKAGFKSYMVYVDDVTIEAEAICASADKIRIHDYNNDVTSGKLLWNILGSRNTSWKVKVLTEAVETDQLETISGSSVIFDETVNTNEVSLNILPSTTYYVYIKSNCSDNSSEWVLKEISTPCPALEVGYVWTFEEEGGYQAGTNANNLTPDCWSVGLRKQGGTSPSNYLPYKIVDTNTYTYSYSEGGNKEHALQLRSNVASSSSSTYNGSWAIMPAYAGNMDDLQLRFFARSAYASRVTESEGYKLTTTYQKDASYAHSLIIGMVEDHNDISTFHPIDTITVQDMTTPSTWYANEDNDYHFEEFIIPLKEAKAYGRHIAFLSEFDKSNYIFLDNVTIEPLGFCERPLGLVVEDVRSTSVKLRWNNDEDNVQWIVTLATDKKLENVVRKIPSSTSDCTIRDLNQFTDYYVGVQKVCGETTSRISAVRTFKTCYSSYFRETFAAGTHEPAGWTRHSHKFDGDKTIGDLGLTSGGWTRTTTGYGLSTAHQFANLSTSSSNYWFNSPLIELSTGKDLWLTFDLALTGRDSDMPVTESIDEARDKRFVVIISEDAGITWKTANSIEWNNTGSGDYVLHDVPSTGKKYTIDLTKYSGKIIRIGFYGESTSNDVMCDVHIDNIQVNQFTTKEYLDAICSHRDYTNYGFDITYERLKSGDNEFTRWNLSGSSAVADSLVTVNINVTPIIEYQFEGYFCQGNIYEEFSFKANKEGIYKQKIQSSDGCDSISILNLHMNPIARQEIMDTICQGHEYEFNNVFYSRTGIYEHKLESVATGCDSIAVLYLKVNDAIRSNPTAVICFDGSYMLGNEELTEAGTYTRTLETKSGCDSIVTLTLIKRPQYITEHEGVVCPGQLYYGNGFDGVPAKSGVYTMPLKTTDDLKCDSLVILYLTVLDSDTVYEKRTISENQLPYTFRGKEYTSDIPAGIYRDTVFVNSGNECDAVLIAELTIESASGIWATSYISDLSVAPTIINPGQTVTITSNEQMKLNIEVYDMAGRRIYAENQMSQPIELDTFRTSGMYLIKTTDSNGISRIGRVLVR